MELKNLGYIALHTYRPGTKDTKELPNYLRFYVPYILISEEAEDGSLDLQGVADMIDKGGVEDGTDSGCLRIVTMMRSSIVTLPPSQ